MMDTQYTPWPAAGCTLLETAQRLTEPNEWKAWRWFEDGMPVKPTGCVRLGYYHRIGDKMVQITKEEHLRLQQQRHSELRREIKNNVLAPFCAGNLIAEGKLNDVFASKQYFEADIWPSLVDLDFESSDAWERDSSGIRIKAIRAFPALLAPNFFTSFRAESLGQAFSRYVFQDPEFVELAQYALKKDEAMRNAINGIFKSGGREGMCWPLDLSPYEFPPDAAANSTETALAWACLRHRFAVLGGFLKTGQVTVQALDAEKQVAREISAEEIFAASAWIDFSSGDVLHEISGRLVHRYRTREFHVKPTQRVQVRLTPTQPSKVVPAQGAKRATKMGPVMRAILVAAKDADVDLAVTDCTPKQLSQIIGPHLPEHLRKRQTTEALSKAIGRAVGRLRIQSQLQG